MDKIFNLSERTHNFKIKGKLNGKEVEGDFECRFPSALDEIAIPARIATYLGEATVDQVSEAVYFAAYKLAALDVLLTKKPTWYDPSNISGFVLIDRIYKEVSDFTNSFLEEDTEDGPSKVGGESNDTKTVEGK